MNLDNKKADRSICVQLTTIVQGNGHENVSYSGKYSAPAHLPFLPCLPAKQDTLKLKISNFYNDNFTFLNQSSSQ